MKRLLFGVLSCVFLFGFVACGGKADATAESGSYIMAKPDPQQDSSALTGTSALGVAPAETPQPAEPFDFSGSWVCSGMRMGDTESSAADLESWMDMSCDEILSIEVLDDYAVIDVMKQGIRADYTCTDAELIISLDPTMWPVIGDEKMCFTAESDGRISYKEASGTLLLSRADSRPATLSQMLWLYFRPEYTDADTSALASFMSGDMYLRIGDTFYGKMMQKSTHRSALCSFTLTMDDEGIWPEASSGKVLVDQCIPFYLTELDGAIYFLRRDLSNGDSMSVCRISPDGSGLETLIEDAVDYMQIVNGRIYYCNKDYRYCSANTDGSDVKIMFDKEIYECYQVTPGWLLYQDDDDGESLHLRNLATEEDVRIAMGRIYNYGIIENVLFFARVDDDACTSESNYVSHLYRMDLTLPYPTLSDKGELQFACAYEVSENYMDAVLRVFPGTLYTNNGAVADLNSWRDLSNDPSLPVTSQLRYRDDDWFILENWDEAGKVKEFDFYSVANNHSRSYTYAENMR